MQHGKHRQLFLFHSVEQPVATVRKAKHPLSNILPDCALSRELSQQP